MHRRGGQRWSRRPEGSNWGDFGPDDQLGRLNLLTPAKVLQGVAEVREGRTFCLSLPLDVPGGAGLVGGRNPPRLRPTMLEAAIGPAFNAPANVANAIDVFCDDEVTLCLQYSTQWDALAHVGQRFDADGDGVAEIVYYNGWRAGEHIIGGAGVDEHLGALKLGIENMAEKPIQGRAVMLDLAGYLGGESRPISYDDLATIMERDRIVIEPGDMVCLHTGFADLLLGMGNRLDPDVLGAHQTALDGSDSRIHDWVAESGLAALIADNIGVEGFGGAPACGHDHVTAPLHELCLFKLGIPLGELWHLTPLCRWLKENGRSRFLLTAPPLRLPGAAGSPANAIGTV